MLVAHHDVARTKSSHKYQKHVPYSAGYYFKCTYDDSLSFYKSYRGLDCMEWFNKEMETLGEFIQSKNKNIIPI